MKNVTNQPPISAVIPNWNGARLLELYLPALLDELERYNPASECIVVDDASRDDSIQLLERRFPNVRLVCRRRNSGFATAVNSGIAVAKNALVLLLNNDVEVSPGFVAPLVQRCLSDPLSFASSALQKSYTHDESLIHGGLHTITFEEGHLVDADRSRECLDGPHRKLAFADGGCSLFARDKILEIGGLCTLLDPFYGEDLEISFQAMKRGWTLHFVPESVVIHRRGSSTAKKPWKFFIVPIRNNFIVHWLLLDGAHLWAGHLTQLARRLVVRTACGRLRYAAGFLLALLRLPAIVILRRQRHRGVVYSLAQVLARLNE